MRRSENLVDLETWGKMRIRSLSEASIQKRTSTVKFARSPCTDPPGVTSLHSPFSRVHQPMNESSASRTFVDSGQSGFPPEAAAEVSTREVEAVELLELSMKTSKLIIVNNTRQRQNLTLSGKNSPVRLLKVRANLLQIS